MGADIDQLNIKIEADAQKAHSSVDTLINKLGRLNKALGGINTSNIASLSNGIQRLSSSMQSMKNVGTADFTRLAKNIQKMGNLDSKQLGKAAGSIHKFVNALGTIDKINVSDNAAQIGQLAKGISQLGYKSSTQAIENIPKLAKAMRQLMTELSKAPRVSQNLIQMTNALAKLSRTGASSGRAANSLTKAFDGFSRSSHTATKKSFSLASAIGKVYATYWMLFRAMGKIRDAIDISSQLTEVQNVVDVTFGDMAYKVEEFAKTSIQQFGMSELSLKQYASRFQAMGSAMGISGSSIGSANSFLNKQTNGYVGLSDSMSDVSLNLTKLTADMASFYNVEQKVVAEDLEAIFTGQTRPLRQYGLDLTQATLQEWALKNGIDANVASMSQAEKTMLRYQYVMANTWAAQGDFARTANTWANQVRILKQNFEQLGAVVGGTLINALKPLVQALNAVMGNLIAFAETVSNALGKIFGWKFEKGSGGAGTAGLATDMEDAADSAGGLADKTGKAAKNIDKMKAGLRAFDELKTISMPDSSSGSGSGSGGSGGSSGGGASSGSGGQWTKQDSIFEDYKSSIDSLKGLGEYIRDALIKEVAGIKWEKIYKKAENFGKGLAEFLNGLFSEDKKGNSVFTATADVIAGSLNTALHALNSFGETFEWDEFGKGLARGCKRFFKKWDAKLTGKTFSTFVNGILKSIVSFVDTLNKDGTWKTIIQKFVDFLSAVDFKGIAVNLSKIAQGLLTALKEAIEGMSESDVFTTIGQKIADFICGIDWAGLSYSFAGLWDAIKDAVLDIPKDFVEGFVGGIIENIFGEEAGKKVKDAIDNFADSKLGKALSKFNLKTLIGAIPALKAIDDFVNNFKKIKSITDLFGLFGNSEDENKEPKTEEDLKQKRLNEDKYKIPVDIYVPTSPKDLFEKYKKDWDFSIKDKFLELKSKIKDKASELWDKIKKDWDGVKEKVAEFKTKIKDKASDLWDGLKKNWKNVKDKVAEFGAKIKDKAEDLWDKLHKGWNNVKDKVADFKARVESKAQDLWDKFHTSWNNVKDKVADFKTRVKSKASDLWNDFNRNWGESRTAHFLLSIKSKISELWGNFKKSWGELKTANFKLKISSKISELWNGFKRSWGDSKKVSIGIGFVKGALNGLWTSVKNFFGGKSISVGANATKKADGGAFYNGSWHPVAQYAAGGFPNHGSLFVAGEAGSELVGHIGGRTEVLNQSQLASTMYSSVLSAMETALSKQRGSSQQPIQVYLDGKVVFDNTRQRANEHFRRTGESPFPY